MRLVEVKVKMVRAGVAWCHEAALNEAMRKSLREFFFFWLACSVVFSVGLFYVAQVEALHYTIGAGLVAAIAFVLAARWVPIRHLFRARFHSPTAQLHPLKVLGMAVLGVYVAGTWAYGIWYIWEYWQGYWGFGILAWNGFIRALIWPVWVALALA